MGRRTIREAPDDLWALVEPILVEHDPPKQTWGAQRIARTAVPRGVSAVEL